MNVTSQPKMEYQLTKLIVIAFYGHVYVHKLQYILYNTCIIITNTRCNSVNQQTIKSTTYPMLS